METVAVTLKLTAPPTEAIWLAGCEVMCGPGFSEAALESVATMVPFSVLVTLHAYIPMLPAATGLMFSVGVVAPPIPAPLMTSVPSFFHWYESAAPPFGDAVTEKLVEPPTDGVVLVGWPVMIGATLSVAALDAVVAAVPFKLLVTLTV